MPIAKTPTRAAAMIATVYSSYIINISPSTILFRLYRVNTNNRISSVRYSFHSFGLAYDLTIGGSYFTATGHS